MSKAQIQALVIRALKTFVQAFAAVFLAGLVSATSQVALKALLVGAFAAGVSAVMNLYIKPVEAK
jgi:hypothetical protein